MLSRSLLKRLGTTLICCHGDAVFNWPYNTGWSPSLWYTMYREGKTECQSFFFRMKSRCTLGELATSNMIINQPPQRTSWEIRVWLGLIKGKQRLTSPDHKALFLGGYLTGGLVDQSWEQIRQEGANDEVINYPLPDSREFKRTTPWYRSCDFH